MIIRKMIEEDLIDLSKLYEQFWGEKSEPAKMAAQFCKLKDNTAYIFLSAMENETLAGSVMGIVCEELYGDCEPFLLVEDMIVDKHHRKKGIGTALFTELEKLAREKDCVQILLVTETNRNDACGFYESLGFHPFANKGYKKKL